MPHSLPIAVEMARRHPQIEVRIAAVSKAHLELARRYAEHFPGVELGFDLLRIPAIARREVGQHGLQAMRKLAALTFNRGYFDGFDALVAPERTSLVLQKLGVRRPKYVWTRHGAGDRANGFQKEIAQFDFVLMAGRKLERRLLKLGLIRPGRYAAGVYAKFDFVKVMGEAKPPLFANRRPTVLYNPHFWRSLSSWPSMGRAVLDWFAANDRYNCVFAPHVRLFDPPLPRKYTEFEAYAGLEHMRIDLGSSASIDMTYTLGADLYLGDVSSQVSEFLVRPRPCVFLNPRGRGWKGDESFRFWELGEVIGEVEALPWALERAFVRQPERQALQRAYRDETFEAVERSTSALGADAVAAFLEDMRRVA